MTTRADVAAEARRWLATPFAHQGRTLGIGCDCGGLVGGVAVALGIVPPTWWRDTFDPQFGGYSRQPANGTLQRVCEAFMTPTDEPDVGDVLLMRFASEPQHLAICAGETIIHAYEAAGLCCEHRLSSLWAARIVRVYRFRGIS